MANKRRYIKASYLPPRLPTMIAAVGWLLLDRLDAPGWAHGVLWTIVVMLVIAFIFRLCTEVSVDI